MLASLSRPFLAIECFHFLPCGSYPSGDYDGDTFLVCWDKDLIPSFDSHIDPMDYKAADQAINCRVYHPSLVRYFATHDSRVLGKLNT